MQTKYLISKTLEGSKFNMKADTEGKQIGESFLNVTDKNIWRDDFYEEMMTTASDDEGEDILFTATAEDTYNFHVSVAVTDLQSDQIDAEFSDAIEEINVKNFQCSQCNKVCKSKGGLTRHTRSKHLGDKQGLGETRTALFKETVHSMVETIKAKLNDEKFILIGGKG